jgi:hypothetical protein
VGILQRLVGAFKPRPARDRETRQRMGLHPVDGNGQYASGKSTSKRARTLRGEWVP